MITLTHKTCRKCGRDLPISCFSVRGEGKVKKRINIDCKECISKESKIVRDLKKTAPPVPEVCDCCGKIPLGSNGKIKWCLDHNHQTNTFRGWLCERCNLGIGQLGDNIDGVQKAVKYLKECEQF